MSPFWVLAELRVMEEGVTTGAIRRQSSSQMLLTTNKPTPSFLQAGPTNSVKELKGKDM